MILVDTSVWVDHLRSTDKTLAALLDAGTVLSHPFVIGELALGNLCQRKVILNALGDLPRATVATDAEVLYFIDRYGFQECGIGYVDAHLLAATLLTSGAKLCTADKRLRAVAARLELTTTPAR